MVLKGHVPPLLIAPYLVTPLFQVVAPIFFVDKVAPLFLQSRPTFFTKSPHFFYKVAPLFLQSRSTFFTKSLHFFYKVASLFLQSRSTFFTKSPHFFLKRGSNFFEISCSNFWKTIRSNSRGYVICCFRVGKFKIS